MPAPRYIEGSDMGGFAVPPYMLRTFSGSPDTLETMRQQAWGDRGERSMKVRAFTEHIVRDVWPKDYLSEILAVRNFCTSHLRYRRDPNHVELVKDPERIIDEVIELGVAQVDCDEIAEVITTMVMCLGNDSDFVVVGFEQPHDYSHVFSRAREPKHTAKVASSQIVLDPVAGQSERDMLERATTWAIWSLDDDSPGPHEVYP